MRKTITVKIARWDPAAGELRRHQVYRVLAEGPRTVLSLLKQLYEEQDETLAFRPHCCRLGLCNICMVKVNGKNVRGCAKTLNPGDEAELSPAYKKVIRDLVCSLE